MLAFMSAHNGLRRLQVGAMESERAAGEGQGQAKKSERSVLAKDDEGARKKNQLASAVYTPGSNAHP